jgi:hypothetical protein
VVRTKHVGPIPNPPIPPQELQRLRRRFVSLMILQGVLAAAALIFAAAYFAWRQAWGLPAFAIALVAGVAAQVRFIWTFRNGGS